MVDTKAEQRAQEDARKEAEAIVLGKHEAEVEQVKVQRYRKPHRLKW